MAEIEFQPADGSADASASNAQANPPLDDAASPCSLSEHFGPPTFVPGLTALATAIDATWVGGLRLSPDLLTGYFHANGLATVGGTDLYVAQRSSAVSAFESFAPLGGAGFNTVENEYDPTVSGDGLTIVFERQSLDATTTHLYYGTRAAASGPFTYVGALEDVNASGANDASPYLRQDGQVLYFTSDRGATHTPLIYRSIRDGSGADLGFATPQLVTELSTGFGTSSPVVTPDDLTVYFSSSSADLDGAVVSSDFVATRSLSTDPFSAPATVPELDLEGANDVTSVQPTFVSADGCVLFYFTYAWSTQVQFGAETQYYAEKPAN